MTDVETFDQWAVVEVMGHHVYAGRVTEQALGGGAFVRIDVPEIDGREAFTKLFGHGSIFCITPCDRDVAVTVARYHRARPFESVHLPTAARLGYEG